MGNQVARDFGFVFSLPEILRPVYKNFGIALEAANGDSSFELPVPATYVMNQEGVIQFDFVDVDYTKRAEPEMRS